MYTARYSTDLMSRLTLSSVLFQREDVGFYTRKPDRFYRERDDQAQDDLEEHQDLEEQQEQVRA